MSNHSQSRPCQNCKNPFTIESEDFDFYQKIEVPPPTFCPECRLIRRLSFMNIRSLYKRGCDKCGKIVVSMYSDKAKNKVYCQPCWWKDDWDGTEYAKEYDNTRPFLEQVKELVLETPFMALENQYTTFVNSEFVNYSSYLKNCYLVYFADYSEDCYYSMFLNETKQIMDCYRVAKSELCYESIGLYKSYNVFFSEECSDSNEIWFSKNLSGCTNCFGCINLRNKSYYIWNEPYTKEEYAEKIKSFNLTSRIELQKMKKKAEAFWLQHPHRSYVGNSLNVDVSGDYIYESKNAKECFMVTSVENGKYIQFISVPTTKDSYDYTGWGANSIQIYEAINVGVDAYNVKFCTECWPSPYNAEYSIYANSCKNSLGSVNIKKKNYTILNKEYSKEAFEALRKQILEDMDKNPFIDKSGIPYTYGEFFPNSFSHFGYNETMAQQFYPKSKEDSIRGGYNWVDIDEKKIATTILSSNLPDVLSGVGKGITSEIIECKNCLKAYKLTTGELELYERMNLPLPDECPECRHQRRFKQVNRPHFYDRTCDKCNMNIRTSYAPGQPQIVYCEKCYQDEII